MQRSIVLGGILVLLVAAWGAKHLLRPNLQECETCHGTGAQACGAPGCEAGRVGCTGPCLRKDTPGWQTANIPGYPPDLLWKGFTNNDGSTQWVSQNHLGQVVENVNGVWTLSGTCPQCGGTGRMPCSACQARVPCRGCNGKKVINRWF
jgi:DnaJ-class molecular chaperone